MSTRFRLSRIVVATILTAVTAAGALAGDCHSRSCAPGYSRGYAPSYSSYRSHSYGYRPLVTHRLKVPAARPAVPAAAGVFVEQLGCEVVVETVTLPQYGAFPCARLVSAPLPSTPLAALGLREGDLITRINGARVTNIKVLQCKPGQVVCRYVESRSQIVKEQTVSVGPAAVTPGATPAQDGQQIIASPNSAPPQLPAGPVTNATSVAAVR